MDEVNPMAQAVTMLINTRTSKVLRAASLLEALSTGKPSAAAYEGLWSAAQTWLQYGGSRPFECFAGLPTTGAALAKASRDLWLRRAAEGLTANTEYIKAHKLAEEFQTFTTRGPWRSWCEAAHPPAEASALRTALFYAAKFNDSKSLSWRTIYRALS
jgi:hypothetical protein